MANQEKNKRGQKYDQSFKEQVLQKVRSGTSIPKVALELGISEGVIYQWQGKLGSADKHRIIDLEKEVIQLRNQLKQVEMERDILKKATAIFSKSG
jgi:transposase